MQPEQAGATSEPRSSAARPIGARTEVERLRSTCRRQARTIETLGAALSTLRSGAAALKAENADLRAVHGCYRGRSRGGADARASGGVDVPEAAEVRLPLDLRAPGAARMVVAECLRGRAAAAVDEHAQLIVSELVTNSVRHSGGSADEVVIVRVQLTSAAVRLEVEDSGIGGVIAPRRPDVEGGGGFGLNVVQTLSERWGLERVAGTRTRVWAQLRCRPLLAAAAAGPSETADGAR
jgi:anti-sigma regulatory factor (Ser/Thr protein kinase)